jgi:hypothetical protein
VVVAEIVEHNSRATFDLQQRTIARSAKSNRRRRS